MGSLEGAQISVLVPQLWTSVTN